MSNEGKLTNKQVSVRMPSDLWAEILLAYGKEGENEKEAFIRALEEAAKLHPLSSIAMSEKREMMEENRRKNEKQRMERREKRRKA